MCRQAASRTNKKDQLQVLVWILGCTRRCSTPDRVRTSPERRTNDKTAHKRERVARAAPQAGGSRVVTCPPRSCRACPSYALLPRLPLPKDQNLPVGKQTLAQSPVIHLLHRDARLERQRRRRSRRLAEDHKDGLHPDRPI